MFNFLARLFSTTPAVEPRPNRVAPAQCVGDLEMVPKSHQKWAELLLGGLPLDAGAHYWHIVSHQGVILRTRFTEEEIAEFLRVRYVCRTVSYDTNMGATHYGNVMVTLPYDSPLRESLGHEFNIEVQGFPVR